ncbi:hypothetical protein J4H86_03820 [Spiractinospora alimapuensis]|uniref:hypothetical protein n=1 Tax=Spiractinospora alimapuensis TaxID=2820884 RepID=UPI001F3F5B1A|nr:hypothetical protein [Spiractinospora alimapuensis]QVQ52953.1 hypothetical protein J4H86_03820 [Spiractinospora alimapuensis]
MDSTLPTLLLTAAGLLAVYVCIRVALRIFPHALKRDMQRLQDATEDEAERRKLPHTQQQLTDMSRSVATKKQLIDQLHARWRAVTDGAAEVPEHVTDPEWVEITNRLDAIDQELEQQEKLAQQRNRKETEEVVAEFDRSVRRLWWLNIADIALFLASGAVVIWVMTALFG